MNHTQPTDPEPEEAHLFGHIPTNHPLHVAVRDGLRSLREHTDDPELARALDDVLAGRRTVRDLRQTPAFTAILAEAAERSRAETAHTTPDQLAGLRAATLDRKDDHD